ncbi:MAG: MFS transporter [Chitinophagaceae bacterium]|nr:MAG: MFS transporter [Chitinophagaceae bacterium]
MKIANKRASWYPWGVVGVLWVVAFLNYLDRILITSMRDPIVKEFTLDDAQFGLLTSVFLWSYGILSPFAGYLADKYSRKKVIVFSVAVWSAVTVWTGFVSSFEEMILARIFMGISEAFYIPAALAMISDYHRGRTRSLATGLHFSGLYTGLALGGIGGFIAEWWGWRYGFQVFGIFGCIYAIFIFYYLKDRKAEVILDLDTPTMPGATGDSRVAAIANEPIQFLSSMRLVLQNSSFRVLLFYFVMLGVANWLIYGWLPTFLKDQFNLSLGEAGLSATGYVQIGSFIGVVAGGLLADRWFRTNQRSRLYMIIIGFSVGAPVLFLMSSTYVFGIAIAAMIAFGLARGFNDANLMPIVHQVIDNRYVATGYGLLNFLSTIVGGLMVYIGGALKDAQIDLSVIYKGAAVLLLIATWSLFAVKIKKDH